MKIQATRKATYFQKDMFKNEQENAKVLKLYTCIGELYSALKMCILKNDINFVYDV